jgi:hypothetical protein
MSRMRFTWLVVRALLELVRYDLTYGVLGFQYIQRQLARRTSGAAPDGGSRTAQVCEAVELAGCLYWKPVLCLQRSVCMVRLLRASSVDVDLVIGYRPVPFFSHAWVEIDGRVLNDSPVYQRRLRVLHRI